MRGSSDDVDCVGDDRAEDYGPGPVLREIMFIVKDLLELRTRGRRQGADNSFKQVRTIAQKQITQRQDDQQKHDTTGGGEELHAEVGDGLEHVLAVYLYPGFEVVADGRVAQK